MTIEELYSQTNLNEYVQQGTLYQYEKKYKISVFNVHFNAVKFEKRNKVKLFYLRDFNIISIRFFFDYYLSLT